MQVMSSEIHLIVKSMRRNIGNEPACARTMPPEVYSSQEFLDLEWERIFGREWHCVGRAESISEPGEYITARLNRQPVIVIRQRDRSIRALSNVCLHRMMKLVSGKGKCRRIVCPYHAWTYEIDGRLVAAQHMQENCLFDKTALALPEIRCAVWQGWIYVTMNPEIPEPERRLAGLERIMRPYHASDYVEVDRQEHVWKTNWKLLTENFMEGYHLPFTHRKTVGAYFPVDDTRFGKAGDGYTHQWFTKDSDAPVGTAHRANKRLRGKRRRTSVLGTVYPCHMFVLGPDHLWYLSLQPRSPGEIDVLYGLAFAPEVMDDTENVDEKIAEAKRFLDRTNEEDRVVVEDLYNGVRAPLAKPGPLSWLEKQNLDFARYILTSIERS